MYAFQEILKGLKQPKKVMRELNRLYHTRFYSRDFNTGGTDIVEEDWDNLIILDACRYDMFERLNTLGGKLEKKNSRGASTIEFLKGNFRGRELHDTVYLTANPQLKWNSDDIRADFFKVIDLWEEENFWNDEHSTVPPEKVTEKAREVMREYPEKRLIVHYMQPHFPFLPYGGVETMNVELKEMFWNRVMTGEISIRRDKIWEMYNGNLQRALESVHEMLEHLEGKTVVTSDHGNLVGEDSSPIPVKEWGHPIGIYHNTLVEVPWLILETGKRKEIVSEEPLEEDSEVDEEAVKEKLNALGYH